MNLRFAGHLLGLIRRRAANIPVGALLCSLGLALVITLLSTSFHEFGEARKAAQTRAKMSSRAVAGAIDAFLTSTHVMLETLSIQPAFVLQNRAEAEPVLVQLLASNPVYTDIWATRADGWDYAGAAPPPGGQFVYVGDHRYFQEAVQDD
ncbi:MAG TPA: hypothetical protein VGL40_08895, partial [Bacillota bacterium]